MMWYIFRRAKSIAIAALIYREYKLYNHVTYPESRNCQYHYKYRVFKANRICKVKLNKNEGRLLFTLHGIRVTGSLTTSSTRFAHASDSILTIGLLALVRLSLWSVGVELGFLGRSLVVRDGDGPALTEVGKGGRRVLRKLACSWRRRSWQHRLDRDGRWDAKFDFDFGLGKNIDSPSMELIELGKIM